MITNRASLALAVATTLLLGACNPATIYTDAEAPRNVTLDTSTTRVDLHFAPGSAQLTPAETAQLRRLAASAAIGAPDRVTIGAAARPSVAARRTPSDAAALPATH